MGNEGLKNCPFCAGDDIRLGTVSGASLTWHQVSCDQCGATVEGSTEEEAIRRWNTRPDLLSSGKDREAIARIIDPSSFDAADDIANGDESYAENAVQYDCREALAKADLILSLPKSEGEAGLREELERIASGEAFRCQRFAEDDDADYFLRALADALETYAALSPTESAEVGK